MNMADPILGSDGAIYINLDEGLGRVMKNGKLYARLLKKFTTDTNLGEILTTVQAADYEKAQVQAHTLKGIAANLSLTELYKQTVELEAQIKGKSVNQEIQDSIKKCYDETVVLTEKVIEQYGG
jgi:HPt (histidine-containing phosphotransfer) domain-containing protein